LNLAVEEAGCNPLPDKVCKPSLAKKGGTANITPFVLFWMSGVFYFEKEEFI